MQRAGVETGEKLRDISGSEMSMSMGDSSGMVRTGQVLDRFWR